MRRLIHVPIIHSTAELGSLSASVKTHYARFVGPDTWRKREQAVAEQWRYIREKIQDLGLQDCPLRIYQDGLPACGFEEAIVRELAAAGSSNHQLIMELVDEGATLEGTEDVRLLLEEYQMQKSDLESQPLSERLLEERAGQAEQLLKARDSYIAERIDTTLQPGETGLAFLGALHRLDALKQADIQVTVLGQE